MQTSVISDLHLELPGGDYRICTRCTVAKPLSAFQRKAQNKSGPQITLLDDEVAVIEGVAVLGTTLWAECGHGTADEWLVANGMRDFSAIRTTAGPRPVLSNRPWRTFQPADAYHAHVLAKDFLEAAATAHADKPLVLFSHHAPSWQSGHGHLYGSPHLDSAYCSNMVDFLHRHKVRLAIHGHTHHLEHYRVDETLVIANPRGYYPYERRSREFDPTLEDFDWSTLT